MALIISVNKFLQISDCQNISLIQGTINYGNIIQNEAIGSKEDSINLLQIGSANFLDNCKIL